MKSVQKFGSLLLAALMVNTLDSIPVRRFKDRWKQRKVA